MVFVRESTRELLLLKSRLSKAAQTLLKIASAMFPTLPRLPQEMTQQLAQLLAEISDSELTALVEATPDMPLSAPFNLHASFTSVERQASHRAMVDGGAWLDMRGLARTEKASRESAGRRVPHSFHRMLTFQPVCQLESGGSASGRLSYDEPGKAFLEELHRSSLRPDVRLASKTGAPPFRDVSDRGGRVSQRLYLCLIPEELFHDGACPWLRPAKDNAPLWLPSDAVQLQALLQLGASRLWLSSFGPLRGLKVKAFWCLSFGFPLLWGLLSKFK